MTREIDPKEIAEAMELAHRLRAEAFHAALAGLFRSLHLPRRPAALAAH